MTPDDWKRIKRILDGTLELSPSKRSAFLDEACGDDDEIRREVEFLLVSAVPTHFLEESPVATPAGLAPGGTVGSYRILEEIGRGGMGVVYRVLHTGLDREFALKTLTPSPTAHFAIEAFQREAKVLGALKHPNIIDVTDFGTDGSRPYLVMELIQGSTLRELCSRPLSHEDAVRVLEGLAEAVDHAHSHGVLHGDLKPENVILGTSPADGLKVLDFGVARLVRRESDAAQTEKISKLARKAHGPTDGLVAGTPSYMAPELFSGTRPTIGSDLYALAVLAFEILVGQRPFTVTEEFLSGSWKRPLPPRPSSLNPSLPVEVDRPLMAALSLAPGDRPSSASGFTEEIRRALERGRLRVLRRRRAPTRLCASVALAVAMSLVSLPIWNLRWSRQLESRLLDARWVLSPRTPASSEILVVTVDDRWLAAEPRSLSQQGDIFGRHLQSMFSAGARAIALDIVLPAAWSGSEEFSTLVLSHTDRLTLAAFGSFTDGTIRGQECIHPLTASLLGPERLARLFGLVNLEPDDDGVVRRGRWGFLDLDGRARLAWASRAALTLRDRLSRQDEFFLDQSVAIDEVAQISFVDIPETLRSSPELVRDRLVIVGATYEGAGDTFRTNVGAGEGESVPGVFVQANLLQTLLSGIHLAEVPQIPLLVVCGVLFAVLSALLLLPLSPSVSLTAAPATLLLFGGVALAAFRWFHVLIPMAGPMTSLVLTTSAAFLLRRILP